MKFIETMWVISFGMVIAISVLYYIMMLFPVQERKYSRYQPTVTIQIPTRNDISAIRCAQKCLEFDYPYYDVLIGDDGSDLEVSQKLQGFAEKHAKVKVIKRKSNAGHKAGNLNNLQKHSNGEIIVVLDSDSIPQENFLERITDPFSDEQVGAVQARIQISNISHNIVTIMGGTFYIAASRVAQPFISDFHGSCFLLGTGVAIRGSVLKEAGMWNTDRICEDIDLSMSVIEKGYDIVYQNKAVVQSETPFRLKDLLTQHTRWSYGTFQTAINHCKKWFFSNSGIRKKLILFSSLSGYLLSPLSLYLLFGGFILLFDSFNVNPFLYPFSSGAMVFAAYGLVREQKADLIPFFYLSMLILGILLVGSETLGVLKALFGFDQKWRIPEKSLNLD